MSDLKERKKQKRMGRERRMDREKYAMEAVRHIGLRERQIGSKSKVQEKMHATGVKKRKET